MQSLMSFPLFAAVAAGLSVQLVEWISERHLPKEDRHQLRFGGEGGCGESLWASEKSVSTPSIFSAVEELGASLKSTFTFISLHLFLAKHCLNAESNNSNAL